MMAMMVIVWFVFNDRSDCDAGARDSGDGCSLGACAFCFSGGYDDYSSKIFNRIPIINAAFMHSMVYIATEEDQRIASQSLPFQAPLVSPMPSPTPSLAGLAKQSPSPAPASSRAAVKAAVKALKADTAAKLSSSVPVDGGGEGSPASGGKHSGNLQGFASAVPLSPKAGGEVSGELGSAAVVLAHPPFATAAQQHSAGNIEGMTHKQRRELKRAEDFAARRAVPLAAASVEGSSVDTVFQLGGDEVRGVGYMPSPKRGGLGRGRGGWGGHAAARGGL